MVNGFLAMESTSSTEIKMEDFAKEKYQAVLKAFRSEMQMEDAHILKLKIPKTLTVSLFILTRTVSHTKVSDLMVSFGTFTIMQQGKTWKN